MKKKEEKEPSKFSVIWANKQSRAAIKLLGYFIFIGFVIILGNVFNSVDNNNAVIEESITYGDMQNALLENNYKYNYDITIDSEKIIYEGETTEVSDSGYKKTSLYLKEYYVDDTGVYQIKLDDKIVDNTIYEEINKNYITPSYIFKTIELISPEISYDKEKTIYKYNISEDLIIEININDISIENIKITSGSDIYLLTFKIIEE